MRIYELIFIVKPDLPEEEIQKAVSLVKETIESGHGTIDKIDEWGKRRMAYKVQKYQDGIYVLVQYSVEEEHHELPKEIERRLRVADSVIKFMTVRIDEDLKRIKKLQAAREKRTSRRPASAAPARPSVSGATPATPGAPTQGTAS